MWRWDKALLDDGMDGGTFLPGALGKEGESLGPVLGLSSVLALLPTLEMLWGHFPGLTALACVLPAGEEASPGDDVLFPAVYSNGCQPGSLGAIIPSLPLAHP